MESSEIVVISEHMSPTVSHLTRESWQLQLSQHKWSVKAEIDFYLHGAEDSNEKIEIGSLYIFKV